MRLHHTVQRALDECGVVYELRGGSKHHKLFVGGRLAGIIPHGRGGSDDRARKNLLAQIRRTANVAKRGVKNAHFRP